jgi:hypothetical protein
MTLVLMAATTIQAQTKQVTWTKIDSPITNGTLTPTAAGSLIWGDYNNDGLLDAFLVGGQGSETETAALYKNNGNNSFTEIPMDDFFKLTRGSAAFIDYDNDGNLDLLVTGGMMGMPIALLYRNSGSPKYEFNEVISAAEILPPISIEGNDHNPRVIYAFDYNNDGWTDIIMNGSAGDEPWKEQGRVVALFKNNQGTFEHQEKPVNGTENFRPLNGGALCVGDVNRDGYADLIASGYADGGVESVTDLYINKGDGTFYKWADSQQTFTGHQQGDNFFIDVNNDGWMDIIEIGRDLHNSWAGFGNLYLNNQNLTFTKLTRDVTGLPGGQAVVSVGDINNDGWTDLFAAGWETGAKFMYNNGDTTFTAASLPATESARGGFDNFVDINNDNTLDFTILGYVDNVGFYNAMYKNDRGAGIPTNNAPSAPTNVKVIRENDKYILSWDSASDDHTPQNAIRYNVSVDFKNGKKYAYVPADAATGKIKVNGLQPFITSNSFELNLPEGDYTFAVQAVDQANVGGLFSTVSSLTGIDQIAVSNVRVKASKGNIHIHNKDLVSVNYRILSINGQTLASGICNAGSTASSSTLPSGVYLVKLLQGNAAKTIKVSVF